VDFVSLFSHSLEVSGLVCAHDDTDGTRESGNSNARTTLCSQPTAGVRGSRSQIETRFGRGVILAVGWPVWTSWCSISETGTLDDSEWNSDWWKEFLAS
jgi:hypothetical protein